MATLVSLQSIVFSYESGDGNFDSSVLKYCISFPKIIKLKIKFYIYY